MGLSTRSWTIFLFGLLCVNVAWSLQVDYLECRGPLNKEHSGVCVVQSDKCCEVYAAHMCRKEWLLKNFSSPAPSLRFFNDSLMIDPKKQLLCVRGFRLSDMSASVLERTDISGVHLQVEVVFSNRVFPTYSSSAIIIFPGHVSKEALENGIYCVDVTLFAKQLTKSDANLVVRVITLPSQQDQVGVLYTNDKFQPFVSVKKISEIELLMENCQKWSQFESMDKAAKNHAEPLKPKTVLYKSEFGEITDKQKTVFMIVVCVLGLLVVVWGTYQHLHKLKHSDEEFAKEMLRKNIQVLPGVAYLLSR